MNMNDFTIGGSVPQSHFSTWTWPLLRTRRGGKSKCCYDTGADQPWTPPPCTGWYGHWQWLGVCNDPFDDFKKVSIFSNSFMNIFVHEFIPFV